MALVERVDKKGRKLRIRTSLQPATAKNCLVWARFIEMTAVSHQGRVAEFSVVFFQPVYFVPDGRVVDRGQQSVSLLHHRLDGPIMGLDHLQQSLETHRDFSFLLNYYSRIHVNMIIVHTLDVIAL